MGREGLGNREGNYHSLPHFLLGGSKDRVLNLDDGIHGITFPILKDELWRQYLLRDPQHLSHENLDWSCGEKMKSINK